MKMFFQAITLYFEFAIWYYGTRASGTQCKIQDLVADCSHLKLSSVPSDLPVNITVLNLSHNQLKHLPASALSRYSQLQALDSGYNVVTKIEENLCKVLPFLQMLGLEHNQLSQLSVHYFSYCSNLTELYIQFNRIKKITGDPFTNLQELTVLDVSHNKLTSAKLGTERQLPKLQRLVLSANKITQLKNDDFDFLNSSTLYQLDLSSNGITEFEPGCFRKIGSLHGLLLDNVVLDPRLAKHLCGALSYTDIAELFLRNTHLKIERSTFAELNKTNLTVLDLSNNRLTTLQNNSFQWLRSLEYLQLENNSIKHVIPKTFAGLENLRYLNLKKGLTQAESVIDDYSFQELGNLVELNLEDNNIAHIKAHTFSGLKNLKYLSLYKTSVVDLKTITNETFMSLAESPLVSLNLTKTKISKLQPGAFSWLKKLKKLDIGLNSIAQILTGEEFRGLTEIEVMYLSYNSKLILSSRSFVHVPSLKILMLSKSAIVSLSLQPSPFDCIKNLTILDLSNNNLANLDKDVFRELQHLQVLMLQHNNLARLWKSVNPGGPVLYLSGLKELRILDLQSNGLDELPEKAFQGLYKLNNLDLSLNNLNFLPDVVFDDLKSLKLLHMQKNLITSVEKDVFNQVFNNLSVLYMGFNPFDCTCESISWFVTWLNKTNSTVPGLNSQYFCNTPPSYHNHTVVAFDISPCKEIVPFKGAFIISSSIILVFIFAVFLIHFNGWWLEFYWNVCVNRIFGFKEIDHQGIQFEYDAYIIHAKNDINWVNKYLLPLEQQDQKAMFQFCLEERDSEVGISELESIVNSIRQSRKIIFVMTQELLKDPWCRRFKVHQAMQQVIQQSRDSIILIFLHDIPDYKLHQMLCLRRGMFKSHCILTWPTQSERIPAFHQKLQIALGSTNRVQ
ncbi:toll-like receptor 3 [Stegostoma tigrinum]|uniref:toll-like receptor 3 n=1 Tax=Stegostoma tigrinum TaxID=3053191 RepID=UPI00202B63A3|nr:toll-like receptor 3 [Stegostoma tigrinum]XP_059500816.1 toll-like receptor 3 [Stegostoma tigrinum]XP_059500817.1 toll-like receptor 3 [Stegostoma tigrinum]